MQFSTMNIAFVASFLLSMVAATPVESAPRAAASAHIVDPLTVEEQFDLINNETNKLEARAGDERLYLVNCENSSIRRSEMNYYAHKPAVGTQPDSVATVSSNGWVGWEGNAITGRFPAGDTAISHIDSNGQSVGINNRAGYATNSFGQTWNCYMSDQHVLHVGASDPNYICRIVYWCRDA